MDNIVISAISGGVAGIFTDLIFFPIETIKTRIQASNISINYTLSAAKVNKYKGVLRIKYELAFIINVSFISICIYILFKL